MVLSATRDTYEIPEDLQGKAVYHRCLIQNAEDRATIFQWIQERFGRLDLLVNNAGVAPLVREDILKSTEESFDRVVGINTKGTVVHGASRAPI